MFKVGNPWFPPICLGLSLNSFRKLVVGCVAFRSKSRIFAQIWEFPNVFWSFSKLDFKIAQLYPYESLIPSDRLGNTQNTVMRLLGAMPNFHGWMLRISFNFEVRAHSKMSPDWTSIDFPAPKPQRFDQKVVLEYCPERIFSRYFWDFHISLHTVSYIWVEILTVQNFNISVARKKIDQSIPKT